MRTSYDKLEKRMVLMLRYLADLAGGGKRQVVVSSSQMQKEFGLSAYQVRWTIEQLRLRGYVTVRSRHAPNGGRLENGYCITKRGWTILGIVEG